MGPSTYLSSCNYIGPSTYALANIGDGYSTYLCSCNYIVPSTFDLAIIMGPLLFALAAIDDGSCYNNGSSTYL